MQTVVVDDDVWVVDVAQMFTAGQIDCRRQRERNMNQSTRNDHQKNLFIKDAGGVLKQLFDTNTGQFDGLLRKPSGGR